MGLAFHPTSPLFAASLISGSVKCFHNGASSSSSSSSTSSSASYTLQHTFSDHVESARVVVFNHSGDWVVSGSSDCSLRAYSSETGQSVWEAPRAHLAGLYVLNGQVEGRENLLISGDENGGMRLWDVRQSGEKPLHSCEAHSDYISDMTFDVERQRLLTTSGDGKLGVFEMRKSRVKLERMSDEQEHELLCVQIVKRGKKVVVGAQDGVLNLWSWGTWGDLSDRFPGHPESIDALLKVDEDTVCTGSSDGIIRFISILPNKLIGVAGDHDGFPIERMAFSHDRASIGECGLRISGYCLYRLSLVLSDGHNMERALTLAI